MLSKKQTIQPNTDGSLKPMVSSYGSVSFSINISVLHQFTESNKEKIIKLIYLIIKNGAALKCLNPKDTIFVVRSTIKKWITDR